MAKRLFFTRTPVDPQTGLPLGPSVRRPAFHPFMPQLPTEPAEQMDDDPYPEEGSIDAVLAWVDRAPDQGLRSDRAKAAITAELGRGKPRTTLLPQLEERTGSA